MPTGVRRRGGHYPVRLSLNISEYMSQQLDRWESATGEPRGLLAREALERGLAQLGQAYRQRMARRFEGEPPSSDYIENATADGVRSNDGDPAL